jgi:uncharacterized membrane protein YhaH (DUF805 family)
MDTLLGLFTTDGRANRAWYLWHILLDDVAIFTGILVLVLLTVVTGSPLLLLPAIGVLIGGIWAGICVTVKRLHDLDRPGWHWWLLGVPFYNIYLGLVLLFKKGTEGQNQFGRNPLDAVSTLAP